MKFVPKVLRVLTAISHGAASLSMFDLSGIVHIVPGQFAGPLLATSIGLAAVKELSVVLGDYLDNGKRDGSFKCAALAVIAAGMVAVLGMTSCVTTTSPDGTKTEKADTETIGLFGGFALKFAEMFAKPAPVAVPVVPAK